MLVLLSTSHSTPENEENVFLTNRVRQCCGKGRGPAKRKLAEEFPPGEVLTDTSKKSWKLGAPIGQGGFGLLYLADENTSKPVGADAPYVIKVEPSDNGPLFSELKFYMRAAKPDLIQSWMTSRKLKYLGVPKYWGSGLHEKGGKSGCACQTNALLLQLQAD
ncbi:unnamed protein product [Coregonus sp. 'balchen']|nr:unnamed protein product [Coregonus sp. 'balchen']